MSPWLRVRIIADRGVAAVLLVASAPLIGVCAWLVHRFDGGPGFVAVPRVGQDRRPIRMWKLRSMRADGPAGTANGPALTAGADPRLTPIGSRLRAYHIDELPQLYNVVRGEMCLLGPRPEAPDFVDDSPEWRRVLAMPPGIAGPTQLLVATWEREVITRSPEGDAYRTQVLPVKLAIDEWYVRSGSPGLDLLVVTTFVQRLLFNSPPARLLARVKAAVPQALDLSPR